MAAGLKTETEGSASGDSAAINSTGKEDRKSPVATETKLGGGGFNFGGNTGIKNNEFVQFGLA